MRVYKKHDIRLQEILDAAQQLFIGKGYEETTINDILSKVQIGKGTFYHYFTSKEEVMNAVIYRIVDNSANRARTIVADATLNAHEKLFNIIVSQNITYTTDNDIIKELHRPSNAKMHQKSIVETIRSLSPILADVVRQGISEGTMHTPYPQESIEFVLTANQFIFDAGIFQWQPQDYLSRAHAFVHMTELILGTQPGSLFFILDLLQKSASEGMDHAH
ncbi:MAG: TetR family transcriptional regulator [Firmicutes bacterium]|nr:TetR family transcriptional regulator [Bacillota bacterium]